MRADLSWGRGRLILLFVVSAIALACLVLVPGPALAQSSSPELSSPEPSSSAPPEEGTTPESSAPPEEGGGEEDDGGDGLLGGLIGGGDEEGSGEQTTDKGCDLGSESYGMDMLAPDTDVDDSYMICPPDNYYLEYIDWTNYDNMEVFGMDTGINNPLNDFNPFREIRHAHDHAINGIASTIFTLNAKFMYFTISTMNWAIDFDLVETIGQPVQEVVSRLGEGFYLKWLFVPLTLGVFYAAWLGMVKNKVSEAVIALATAGIVAAFGSWMIQGGAMDVAEGINTTIDTVSTDIAFGAISGLTPGSPEQRGAGNASADAAVFTADAPVRAANAEEEPGGGNNAAQAGMSGEIWKRYVYDPWARLQVSETDAGLAESEGPEILKISNPDDRRDALAKLGEANKESVAPTVDFLYSASHLISSALSLLMSLFFAVLILGMVFMLIASEFVLFFLILSFPIWGLFAVFPGSGIPQRLLFYFVGEMIQILGYKLLISLVLLAVSLIFAALGSIGTAGVLLLNLILTFVVFKWRDYLRRLATPSGVLKSVRDKWERERSRDGDPLTQGDASPVSRPRGGTDEAVGRDPSGGLAEHYRAAKRAHFLPDDVAGEAKAYAVALPGRGVGAARSGNDRARGVAHDVEDAGGGSLLGAAEIDRLAKKRARDPNSLTTEERDTLHRAETMMAAGKNPLSEIRKANREDRLRRRAEHRRGRDRGYSTDEMLAGGRLPGESEADYVRRQREARAAAEDARRNLAQEAGAGRTLTLVGAPRPCASCGNAFTPTDPSETLCPGCSSTNGSGANGSGANGSGADRSAGADGAGVAGAGGALGADGQPLRAGEGVANGAGVVAAGGVPGAGDGAEVGERAGGAGVAGAGADGSESPEQALEAQRESLREQEFARRREQMEASRREIEDATHQGMAQGGAAGVEQFARYGPQAAATAGVAGAALGGLSRGEGEAWDHFQAERQRRQEYEARDEELQRGLEDLGGRSGPVGDPAADAGVGGAFGDQTGAGSLGEDGALAGGAAGAAGGQALRAAEANLSGREAELSGVESGADSGASADGSLAGGPSDAAGYRTPPAGMPEDSSFDPATGIVSGPVADGGEPPAPPEGYALRTHEEPIGDGQTARAFSWEPTSDQAAARQGGAPASAGAGFDPPAEMPAGASFDPASGVVSGRFSAGEPIPAAPEGYEARVQEAGFPGIYDAPPSGASGGGPDGGAAPIATNDGFYEWTPTSAPAAGAEPDWLEREPVSPPAEAAATRAGSADGAPVGPPPSSEPQPGAFDASVWEGGRTAADPAVAGFSGGAEAEGAPPGTPPGTPSGAPAAAQAGGFGDPTGEPLGNPVGDQVGNPVGNPVGDPAAEPHDGFGTGAARQGGSGNAGGFEWGDGSGWSSGWGSDASGGGSEDGGGSDQGLAGSEQAVRSLAARGYSDAQIAGSIGADPSDVERLRASHGIPTAAEGDGSSPRFGVGAGPGEATDEGTDEGTGGDAGPPAGFWEPSGGTGGGPGDEPDDGSGR